MTLKLGNVMMTMGVKMFMDESSENMMFARNCLERHRNGDWGDICEEDKEINDEALRCDEDGKPSERIMSSYEKGDEKLWIITEWDRSVTTLLLPEEY